MTSINELIQDAMFLDISAFIVTFLIAILVYFIFKKWIIAIVNKYALRSKMKWDDVLVEKKVFSTMALLSPALVFYYGMEFYPLITQIVQRLLIIYVLFVLILLGDKLLSAFADIYEKFPVAKTRPIKGVFQLIRLFIYIIGFVSIVALLFGKSPWGILSGIGALTGILLLVFKDTILSFVASMQIATHKLIQIGDWIEMPSQGADGDVVDIALHAVKVQNWDKTIVSIPTYKFIEVSFKNWKGMRESGGRRIKRAIYIDQTSIKLVNDELLKQIEKIDLLKNYIKSKKSEIEKNNKNIDLISLNHPLNGIRITNIGCFRAYIIAYLKSNPYIHQNMTFLVRHLDPTPQGLPLQIYVFTNDTVWANYESIQADIFDQLLSAIPYFDLRVFQYPSGYSLEKIK
ncbi:MAG: mechanosensitive ion channel [Desulfobacterales bacterium]|nr:mechanosensitive ion channel [Desulfobacterales bacterium]